MSTAIKRIKLLKPHTHAGREYQPDNVLVLDQVGMDQDSAAWLIGLGVAEDASKTAPATQDKGA